MLGNNSVHVLQQISNSTILHYNLLRIAFNVKTLKLTSYQLKIILFFLFSTNIRCKLLFYIMCNFYV